MAFVDENGVISLASDLRTLSDATYPTNTAIAPIYDSTTTYEINDYCIYNGSLYKCNTTISTGESWDTTHWTQTNVINELGTTEEPATITPLMDGIATVGASIKYAKEDHVHPTDTSRASANDLSNLEDAIEALGTNDITNNSSNVSGATATAALDTLKTAIDTLLGKMYPVGSIYMSVNSTSPASLFGGTWTQIKDTFLIAAGSTYTAGATGGSATKNLQHAHTTSGHTLTVAEMPAHSHLNRIDADSQTGWTGRVSYYGSGDFLNSAVYKYQSTGSHYYINSSGTASTGGGGSHSHGNTGNGLSTTFNIMPPYLSVYVWKRTA